MNIEGLDNFLKTTPNPNEKYSKINIEDPKSGMWSGFFDVQTDTEKESTSISFFDSMAFNVINSADKMIDAYTHTSKMFGLDKLITYEIDAIAAGYSIISGALSKDTSEVTNEIESYISDNPDKTITYANNSEWIKSRSWVSSSEIGRDLFYHGRPEEFAFTKPTGVQGVFHGEMGGIANFVDKNHFDKYENDASKISERNLEIYTGIYSGKFGYNPHRDELSLLENPIETSLYEQVFSTRFPQKHPDYKEMAKLISATPIKPKIDWFYNTEQDLLELLQKQYYGLNFSFWQEGNKKTNEKGEIIGEKNTIVGTPGDDQVRVVSEHTGKEIVIQCGFPEEWYV